MSDRPTYEELQQQLAEAESALIYEREDARKALSVANQNSAVKDKPIARLKEALEGVSICVGGQEPCWCGIAVDVPYLKIHTADCLAAKAALASLLEPETETEPDKSHTSCPTCERSGQSLLGGCFCADCGGEGYLTEVQDKPMQ